MPWYAWALFLTGPAILLALRICTWAIRAVDTDRRPGFLDLTPPAQAPPRAGKEHA